MRRLLWIDANGLGGPDRAARFLGADFRSSSTGRDRLMPSRPPLSPVDGRLCVYIGVQVGGGAILAADGFAGLAQHLPQLAPQAGGRVMVCDAYGNLILHPERRLVAAEQTDIGATALPGGQSGQEQPGVPSGRAVLLGTAALQAGSEAEQRLTVSVWGLVIPRLQRRRAVCVYGRGLCPGFGDAAQGLVERVKQPLARFVSARSRLRLGGGGRRSLAHREVFEEAFEEDDPNWSRNERLFRP